MILATIKQLSFETRWQLCNYDKEMSRQTSSNHHFNRFIYFKRDGKEWTNKWLSKVHVFCSFAARFIIEIFLLNEASGKWETSLSLLMSGVFFFLIYGFPEKVKPPLLSSVHSFLCRSFVRTSVSIDSRKHFSSSPFSSTFPYFDNPIQRPTNLTRLGSAQLA